MKSGTGTFRLSIGRKRLRSLCPVFLGGKEVAIGECRVSLTCIEHLEKPGACAWPKGCPEGVWMTDNGSICLIEDARVDFGKEMVWGQ